MEEFIIKEKLSCFEYPNIRKLLANYGTEYSSLMKTIEAEKQREAKPVNTGFKHILTNFVTRSEEEVLSYNKIGTPTVILKIDTPYKEVTEENLQMILGTSYPTKWSNKSHLELYLFRNVFLALANVNKRELSFNTSQSSAIDLVQNLKNISIASPESSVLAKFAKKLLESEIKSIERSLLGTNEIRKSDFETTNDCNKNYWVLDIFEHINKTIVKHASARQNNTELEETVDFYEGKRINTKYFLVGCSMSHIEFERENMSLNIFVSSTLSGYFWDNDNIIHIGRPEMLQYGLFLADNLFSLSIIRSNVTEEEGKFIDFYVNLLNEESATRVGMGSLFETTCLLMSDQKTLSSSMPIIDNLVENISVSKELTEKLVSICLVSKPETCIKMSSIGKTLILASTDPGKGIDKYTQRTNRDNKVNENTIRRLRSLFKQKVILSYIKKHGRVPNLLFVPEDLGAQLEMKAAGGNYLGQMVTEISRYDQVKLGKFLESGNEMNVQSRIIDKACTKDNYDPEGNSEREINYYIKNDMSSVFAEKLNIDKSKYKATERKVSILNRRDNILRMMDKHLIVRLSEKEREQKTSARFYGIASFKLKLWISSVMEMIKRAMKLLPGQMMTMTDDERREIMFKMSEKLMEKDAYSLFLDYSGHNTSQRPENCVFLLEEIANMYGFFEGSDQYREIVSLAYVFANIHVIVEDNWSDIVYYSHGQLGAIEGWLGGLWGIQSQLMLEDMFLQLGVKDYIGTTYSDDSCGVFTQQKLNVSKLNDIVRNVQKYGEDMGLIVKLSQTQVTNGRCSMLKEHYYKGEPIDMTLKKMMSISPNGPKVLFDETESVKLIDSGYTSSCNRSTKIELQTLLRNMRTVKLLSSSIRKLSESMIMDELSEIYRAGKHNYEISAKIAIRKISKTNKPFIPAPRSRNIEFYQFHSENQNVLDISLMLLYGPYTTYGYSMTPMPDVLISGYSLSNVKRISYLQGMLGTIGRNVLSKTINLSSNALSYIDNPFPFTGGRRDPSLILKEEIGKNLTKYVTNPELLRFLTLYSKEDEIEYKKELVKVFSNSFSSRVASKFYESSLFAYVDEIISKIDNASTMKMLLGGKKMMNIINKAWTLNYKMKVKLTTTPICTYDELIYERNHKNFKLGKEEEIKLKFINIEEIPIMGKVIHSEYRSMIQPIFKGKTILTNEGRRQHAPQKTFYNAAKFDREVGVEGMFEHKLIFKAYDLVRYVKWIIMDQEKFSGGMSEEDKSKLIKVCDETLRTFTDAKYDDIESNVVCPKGGRYFHRASSGGFNPKTGDMSSNLLTSNYDVTGVDQLLSKTGGTDNNLNLQYLIIYIRVGLSLLEPKPHHLTSLTLTNDILYNIKDVSFKLSNLNNIGELKKLYNITSKERIRNKGKMYYNYSTFVSCDEDLNDKFLNHVSTMREYFIEQESSFRSVHSYMLDQMIVSPELISEVILEQLGGETYRLEGKESFFDKFYRYYKSLNIIANETPSRSVIRGLLYEELFKTNLNSRTNEIWTTELIKHGYSSSFKSSLMRLFLLSTSLSYRMSETNSGKMKLIVDKGRTFINSKQNYEKIRKGKCQFYIKDKRITEMIVNSFPTLGYNYEDISNEANNLCEDIDGIEFEQFRMGSYFLKMHQFYTKKSDKVHYGKVDFNELSISWIDLLDNLGVESALKGFETACSLMVTPDKVSSPTMSAVYPSAKGLIELLKGNNFIREEDTVIELCGGRGDFHLAMMEEKVNHTTLSREDGYNLAMRIPGMTSKKVNFNCFKQKDYIHYFDHDIILMDISHITDKRDCLSSIIGDCKELRKKIILRLNGLNKFLNSTILHEMSEAEINVCIPSLESPGYLYLTVDFSKDTETIQQKNEKTEKLGYNRSLLSSALINAVSKVDLKNTISIPAIRVQDQTEEIISDEVLEEMLLEEEPDYIHVNTEVRNKIKSKEDFQDNLFVYIDDTTALKYRKKLIFIEERLVSKGENREDNSIPPDLIALSRKIRGGDFSIIEVAPNLIKNNKLKIIRGIRGASHDELSEVISSIMSIKYNKRMAVECWKLLLKLSVQSDIVDSEKLTEIVMITKLNKTTERTINSSYRIASQAVLSYKSGRIIEGLLCVAGMDNVRKKAILNHKDKTTRTNLLHYKLYINRIMMISKTFYTDPTFIGISRDEYLRIWNNIEEAETNIDINRIHNIVREPSEMNQFFRELDKELFSFAGHFSDAVNDMNARIVSDIRPNEELVEELKAFGLAASEEEIILNSQLQSHEELVDYYGEEEVYDAWGGEDWGDLED